MSDSDSDESCRSIGGNVSPPQSVSFEEDGESADIQELTCEPSKEREQRIAANILHNANNSEILQLPPEILCYILRWMISGGLDFNSISVWSLVCQKFYAVTKDPLLWHAACRRIWGSEITMKPYNSWQSQFLNRPHLHFNGVYISRTSYIRYSDISSSMCNRPYYIVEYFRMLRFYPNGEVIMLTTPTDPREMIQSFDLKTERQGLRVGIFKLDEEVKGKSRKAFVTAELKPQQRYNVHQRRSGQSNRGQNPDNKIDYEYFFELELISTSSSKIFNKLNWIHHSCCTRHLNLGTENLDIYDISRQYPSLYFNRIRSFNEDIDCPL